MNANGQACEVVITAPDNEWLVRFAHSLVEDRLCAAVHVYPVRSVYRWKGEVYDKTEAKATLHTLDTYVPQIIERTNREHPYVVPCVAVTSINTGNPDYLRWIADETG
jgi:periplasmic divalent cation tolerance protein